MPETDRFNALGAGNGFISCLEVVDVGDYDTVRPIEKLEEAMNVFWHVYAIDADARATAGFSVSGFQVDAEIDIGVDEVDEDEPENNYPRLSNNYSESQGEKAEPKDRVCGTASASKDIFVNQSGTTEPDGSNYTFARVECSVDIVALERGGEPIGYGIKQNQIYAVAYANADDIDESVYYQGLASYGNFKSGNWSETLLETLLPGNNIPPANIVEKVLDEQFYAGTLFIKIEAFGSTLGPGDPGDPDTDVVSADSNFTDLELYTYPPLDCDLELDTCPA